MFGIQILVESTAKELIKTIGENQNDHFIDYSESMGC